MDETAVNKPTLRRHGTDMVSLVAGVIFLGVAGTWALGRADLLDGIRGWLLPALLIGVGVIGLVGIRPHRSGDQRADASRTDRSEDAAEEPDA